MRDDRAEMQEARNHGLKARHETREARAVRKQVAEEIALAIEEASAAIYYGDRHALHEAAEIARQIGSRDPE